MTTAANGTRFRVALQGFSEFERSALASYFRLAADRYPSYEQTGAMDEAHFIVADADDAAVVQAVVSAERAGDTVFIGAQAPEGAMAWMMRPIDPMHVLRELDARVALHERSSTGSTLTPPTVPLVVSREAANGAPSPARRASDVPLRRPEAAATRR